MKSYQEIIKEKIKAVVIKCEDSLGRPLTALEILIVSIAYSEGVANKDKIVDSIIIEKRRSQCNAMIIPV